MTRIGTENSYLYLYGVLLTEELQTSEVPYMIGIDQQNIMTKRLRDITAVITPVNTGSFSQQQLDLQLKDTEWLKENAFHHHLLITQINEQLTVLPMPFCTIFQNEENLESFIEEHHDTLFEKLTAVQGKKEWNVKLFCQTEKAKSYVENNNPTVVELKGKLSFMPKGKQFLMKKKLEHVILSELDLEQSRWWSEIHKQVETLVSEVNLRQNWSKEITERKDEMIANCDFLVDKKVEHLFINKMEALERTFDFCGCTFYVTGPWPPYHFSKIIKETR